MNLLSNVVALATSAEEVASSSAETAASSGVSFDWSALLNQVVSWCTTTGVKILIALVLLFVSFKVINFIMRRVEKRCQKAIEAKKLDKTIHKTLIRVVKIVLKCLVVIALIGYLGIDTSGFSAIIASLGVCVGLAVNGTLSNLAGGVMLLITRPFKVDDYIAALGYEGTVDEVRICTTRLITVDNKVVYVPNGALSTNTIVNYSEKDLRRVDITFGVSYAQDFEKAKKIIEDIALAHELVLKDPAPFVRVTNHGTSSVELTSRTWVKNEDYWTVRFDLLESVKAAFDKEGIQIPYNQLDVHVKND